MTSAEKFRALTVAAETYELAVAQGELRGDAFKVAVRRLYREGFHLAKHDWRRARRAPAREVPPEVSSLIEAMVRDRGGARWHRLLGDLGVGTKRYPAVAQLRHEIGWVLHELGYQDQVIAEAIGVDRTTVVTARRTFGTRLASDDVLAARIERQIASARAEAGSAEKAVAA